MTRNTLAEQREVVLFEKETDFASCLGEMLEAYGLKVQFAGSYDEILQMLERGSLEYLICDLWDHPVTERFLQRLNTAPRGPQKVVFTSIYSESSPWPILQEIRWDSLFMPKPFRCQDLVSFLFPQLATA